MTATRPLVVAGIGLRAAATPAALGAALVAAETAAGLTATALATVAANDLVDAMRRARAEEWWGDSVPEWARGSRVSAVECLGLAWH